MKWLTLPLLLRNHLLSSLENTILAGFSVSTMIFAKTHISRQGNTIKLSIKIIVKESLTLSLLPSSACSLPKRMKPLQIGLHWLCCPFCLGPWCLMDSSAGCGSMDLLLSIKEIQSQLLHLIGGAKPNRDYTPKPSMEMKCNSPEKLFYLTTTRIWRENDMFLKMPSLFHTCCPPPPISYKTPMHRFSLLWWKCFCGLFLFGRWTNIDLTISKCILSKWNGVWGAIEFKNVQGLPFGLWVSVVA